LWARGPHILKFGGGLLVRRLSGSLTAGRDGRYLFQDFLDFALGWPQSYQVAVARTSLPDLARPDYRRVYHNTQASVFAQDAWRLQPRLVVNLGVRYEYFGAPANTGPASDAVVELGDGASLPDRLRTARLAAPAGGALYSSDRNNFAGRLGFSYSLSKNARTLLRGAYGIFYDRPFDNLWQNIRSNSIVLITSLASSFPTDYLQPTTTALARYRQTAVSLNFPELTAYQPGIRDAYVQSYFAGVERRLSDNLVFTANVQGALGRKLITTDRLNRSGSVASSPANPSGRFNPALPEISYRANQGSSSFHALSLAARYSASRLHFQAGYTWSHSIDNQSEPLAEDFFDLSFTQLTFQPGRAEVSAFSRQFDSGADRGSADFDQRHNLVASLIYDIPTPFRSPTGRALAGGWHVSSLAAFRSGFPFSVYASSSDGSGASIYNNRADVTDAPSAAGGSRAVDGGQLLLNAAAFRAPLSGSLGNSGRNAFRGPGLFSVDLSLSRSLALPRLGERRRLTLRADAFNVFNHANLNNPDPYLASPTFGVALYGREGRTGGFPALVPFRETARQIQLLLRFEF
jgi:hypothetical protein